MQHGALPMPLVPATRSWSSTANYLARVFLPELTRHYFDTPKGREYDVAIVSTAQRRDCFSGRMPARAVPRRSDAPDLQRARAAADAYGGADPDASRRRTGRCGTFSVRHHRGSMEELVAHTRMHNLLITGGILAVLAGTDARARGDAAHGRAAAAAATRVRGRRHARAEHARRRADRRPDRTSPTASSPSRRRCRATARRS